MAEHMRIRLVLLAAAVALVLGIAAPVSWAAHHKGDDEEVEFDETAIFFEFNSTDLDLGIQIFFDAEGWEEVEVTGPDGTVFEVENGGGLNEIGSTEVFTESAEPPLCPEDGEDECDVQAAIDAFLMMFPEGEYEFEGETVDGRELEGSAELSWDLPEPVELVDVEDFPKIEWIPGSSEDSETVVGFQAVAEMVIEGDEEDEEIVYVQATDVPADVTVIHTSPEFAQMAEDFLNDGVLLELKVELIAIGENGNKTITEEPVYEAPEE